MLLWIMFSDDKAIDLSQDELALRECRNPEVHVDTKEPYGYFYVGY